MFNFAEVSYPNLFSPAEVETTTLDEYLVRYYPNTDTYIGTKGEEVYVYGNAFGGLLKAGEITDFIELEDDGHELLAQHGWAHPDRCDFLKMAII